MIDWTIDNLFEVPSISFFLMGAIGTAIMLKIGDKTQKVDQSGLYMYFITLVFGCVGISSLLLPGDIMRGFFYISGWERPDWLLGRNIYLAVIPYFVFHLAVIYPALKYGVDMYLKHLKKKEEYRKKPNSVRFILGKK